VHPVISEQRAVMHELPSQEARPAPRLSATCMEDFNPKEEGAPFVKHNFWLYDTQIDSIDSQQSLSPG